MKLTTLVCLAIFLSPATFAKKKPSVVLDPAATEELINLRARQIELEKEISKKERQIRKTDTPARKEARREIEKEQRRAAKYAQELLEVEARAHVMGCEGAEKRVIIHPKAAEHPRLFIYATIKAFNTSQSYVAITYDSEVVVENLCPGGSVILTKRLETWNHGITPIRYSAEGRTKDGTVGISTYYGSDLYPCQGLPCPIFRPQPDWRIQLY